MTKAKWTKEQETALTAEGHRLLVANAGTGKTTTVVGKIMWLLGEDVGVPRCPDPCTLDQIAAITFTEKAAYDLKRKLREELAKSARAHELLWDLETAALGTIHSFCGQLLRENALRMGIDPTFTVLDERDARLQQDLMIRDIVLERLAADDREAAEIVRTYRLEGYKYTNGTTDLVRTAFRDLRWHGDRYRGWCRDGELDAGKLGDVFGDTLDENDLKTVGRCRALYRMAALMQERWEAHEQIENVRDFDSLILSARELLNGPRGEAALAGIRRRYRILIIDEFQDTDGAQRDIAYAIARQVDRPQLFFVGDPKQSIYRFRGADVSIWNQVARDIGGEAPVLPLSKNFRSLPAIIDFVNAAAKYGMAESGLALEQCTGEKGVDYTELVAGRNGARGTVDWIEPESGREEARRGSEADHVGARINELVGMVEINDLKTGEPRKLRYSDIALLYRTRTGITPYKDALRARKIPFFDSSPAGLSERQEILDLLNLLRVIANPADDLRVFAFLRSPFVGLRDEVLVRMRLDASFGSYLHQATGYAESGAWFDDPDHPDIARIESVALRNALDVFKRARNLADRIPIDELVEFVLDETGYRQHLLLLDTSREVLANIDAFLHLVEQHRDHTVGRFLELWDDRDDEDPGLPQGQLYSARDDVVTFSTIHGAKGLEWPVVFLIDTSQPFRDRGTNEYWNDPQLGPIVCPKKEERGARAQRIAEQNYAREQAEQARLLYVSATRARDRLIVLGEANAKNSQAAWLAHGKPLANVQNGTTPARPATPIPAIDLAWLSRVEQSAASTLSEPLPRPIHRCMTSATEQMARARNAGLWQLQYVHGVEPPWQFAPRPAEKSGKVPERIRGDIIHGVLERISEQVELAQVLEETIGEIDMPELEQVLAPGTQYRAALEAEIERVIQSDEWKWYVAGEHYRELPFLHLAGPQEWRFGAFDLYRPDGWIIDFKTHQVSAERTAQVALEYELQMRWYREAAGIVGPVRTQLHFTHSNVVREMD
jgi:ATP-dependent exoDNAse (exonuclease V) beta subunit